MECIGPGAEMVETAGVEEEEEEAVVAWTFPGTHFCRAVTLAILSSVKHTHSLVFANT